jgi:hypothetical protein
MGSRVSDMASIDLPLVRAAALPTLTRTPGPLHQSCNAQDWPTCFELLGQKFELLGQKNKRSRSEFKICKLAQESGWKHLLKY